MTIIHEIQRRLKEFPRNRKCDNHMEREFFTETHPEQTNDARNSVVTPQTQRPGPSARPDVRPKEPQTRRQTHASQPSSNPIAASSSASTYQEPHQQRSHALTDYKRVLETVVIDDSFLSSSTVKAVEINLRDNVLPQEKEIILAAIRLYFVRLRRYPRASELFECILDADFEEEGILREFVDYCRSCGGIENVPFFQEKHRNVDDERSQNVQSSESNGQIYYEERSNVNFIEEAASGVAGTAISTTSPAAVSTTASDTDPNSVAGASLGINGNNHQQQHLSNLEAQPLPSRSKEHTEPPVSRADGQQPNGNLQEKESGETRHEEIITSNEEDEAKARKANSSQREDGTNGVKKPTSTSEWRNRLERILKKEREYLLSRVTCVVCGVKPVEVTLLPCSHLVTCLDCASKCANCPHCNAKVLAEAKTYMG